MRFRHIAYLIGLAALGCALLAPSAGAASGTSGCLKAAAKSAKLRKALRSRKGRPCTSPAPVPGGDGTSTTPTSPPAPTGDPSPPPPQPEPPAPCTESPAALDLMSGLNGCSTASDTASNPDPLPFWGRVDCQDSSRVKQITTGGDQHPTGTGEAQGDDAFRRTTVYDGDDYYGERCELGLNDKDAPNAFYHEGQRRVTYISLRLGPNVDPNSDKWRTVMQMKQAEPYVNPVVAPVLELEVHTGEWWFTNSWNGLWSAPAQANTWTRFAFDIVYSTNPTVGSITIHADLNGDGDSSDAHESSPAYHVATLVPETAGSQWYAPGGSIPDHLRAGIYQNPAHNCPSGCSVDVDNVQVVEPK